jgi:hypothetical protein
LRGLIEAAANRGPVPVPASHPPVASPEPQPEPLPVEPEPDHGWRVAELERELADARERLDGAEERVAAATQRVLELEGDLEHAAETLAAVRRVVGVS